MNEAKTYYLVLRLDSKMIGQDMFGREVKHELPKGQYACPVFESEADAIEHADGRFEILTMKGTLNA
jgi:hypothetical protein